MLPDIWGRHMWFSIHFVAQDYPLEPSADDAINYKKFFENLGSVIPCYKCGVNYNRHFKEMPIDEYLGSRELLFAWTVEFHNIVNKELGKATMTLEEAKMKYSDPDFNKKTVETQKVLNTLMSLGTNTVDGNTVDGVIQKVLLAFVLGAILGVTVYIFAFMKNKRFTIRK
jgi:hypothetical protein